jgi:hypothetical protein
METQESVYTHLINKLPPVTDGNKHNQTKNRIGEVFGEWEVLGFSHKLPRKKKGHEAITWWLVGSQSSMQIKSLEQLRVCKQRFKKSE